MTDQVRRLTPPWSADQYTIEVSWSILSRGYLYVLRWNVTDRVIRDATVDVRNYLTQQMRKSITDRGSDIDPNSVTFSWVDPRSYPERLVPM